MIIKKTVAPPQPASRAVPASAKPAQAVEPKFDRKAYQRELMRQRRAAEKEAGLVSVKLPGSLVDRWKATGPDWLQRVQEALEKAL